MDAFPFPLTPWVFERGVLRVRLYGQRVTGLPSLLNPDSLTKNVWVKTKTKQYRLHHLKYIEVFDVGLHVICQNNSPCGGKNPFFQKK